MDLQEQVCYSLNHFFFTLLCNFLGIIIYSVITPVLCCCGIIGNIISLLVLQRKDFVGSVYTYLAGIFVLSTTSFSQNFHSVLALVDLGTSIVLMLGGISRGVMWNYGWITYDSLIGLPISGVLATIGVLAIVGLTLGESENV